MLKKGDNHLICCLFCRFKLTNSHFKWLKPEFINQIIYIPSQVFKQSRITALQHYDGGTQEFSFLQYATFPGNSLLYFQLSINQRDTSMCTCWTKLVPVRREKKQNRHKNETKRNLQKCNKNSRKMFKKQQQLSTRIVRLWKCLLFENILSCDLNLISCGPQHNYYNLTATKHFKFFHYPVAVAVT